jgi:hypothetical protein
MNNHAAPSVSVKYAGVKDKILSFRIFKQQCPASLRAVHHFYSNKAATLLHTYLVWTRWRRWGPLQASWRDRQLGSGGPHTYRIVKYIVGSFGVDIPLLYVKWINSWWWTEELPETCRVSCQNKFVKLVHLVGFIIKNFFYDARSHELRKIYCLKFRCD